MVIQVQSVLVPPGIEAHVGSSYTLTWESTKFNVFDIAEDIDKSIEEW